MPIDKSRQEAGYNKLQIGVIYLLIPRGFLCYNKGSDLAPANENDYQLGIIGQMVIIRISRRF